MSYSDCSQRLSAMTMPAVLASVLVHTLPVLVITGYLTDERLW
ncbi:hypothetical protein [Mycolicibacterium doricum]|nr:hypothetical protein [Mycolicibacterium doricum]